MWKLAGFHLGPYAQIAFMLSLAVMILLILIASVPMGIGVFAVCFLLITSYAAYLRRVEPTGTLSETTQLSILYRASRRDRSGNFPLDLDGADSAITTND